MHHHSLPVQQDSSTVNGQTCHVYAALPDHKVQCEYSMALSWVYFILYLLKSMTNLCWHWWRLDRKQQHQLLCCTIGPSSGSQMKSQMCITGSIQILTLAWVVKGLLVWLISSDCRSAQLPVKATCKWWFISWQGHTCLKGQSVTHDDIRTVRGKKMLTCLVRTNKD